MRCRFWQAWPFSKKFGLASFTAAAPDNPRNRTKGILKELPASIQGESLTRLLQGFGLGAVVAMGVGFSWGGWTMASTAAEQSATETTAAVVAALAPICVKNFQADSQATANMTELLAEASYKRDDLLEEAGWATFSGSDEPTPGVAKECAQQLAEI